MYLHLVLKTSDLISTAEWCLYKGTIVKHLYSLWNEKAAVNI